METLDIDPASFFGQTLTFDFPAGNPGADITGSPMDGTLHAGDYSVDFSGFDILFNGASIGLSSADFLALLSVVSAPGIVPDEQAPLTGSLDYFATATSGTLAGANIQLHLSNVPLPTSIWLLLSGLSLLFMRAKRRS